MASHTRVILIRHGESNAQAAGLVSGHATCIGLGHRGAEQAGALARRLSRTGEFDGADVVHTSLLCVRKRPPKQLLRLLAPRGFIKAVIGVRFFPEPPKG